MNLPDRFDIYSAGLIFLQMVSDKYYWYSWTYLLTSLRNRFHEHFKEGWYSSYITESLVLRGIVSRPILGAVCIIIAL